MGASAVYCGPVGAGNTTNSPPGGRRLQHRCLRRGFHPRQESRHGSARVLDAIKGGLAGSTVMNAKVPMMLQGNFKPGFKFDLTSRTSPMPWTPAMEWAPRCP